MAFKIIVALALLAIVSARPQDGFDHHHHHHPATSSQSIVIHHAQHQHKHEEHKSHEIHHEHKHHDDEHHKEHHVEHYSHPKYEFSYKVVDPHTGDKKSHHEQRDGDVVKGVYSLHEADGTVRVVEYHADKHSGFVANVKHEGHAVHVVPDHHHH